MHSILYISPKFPSLSAVFQQNEILGIMESGIEVTVLSCRPQSRSGNSELHSFATPILKRSLYPTVSSIALGLALSLWIRPTIYPQILSLLWQHRRSRRSCGEILISLLIAVSILPRMPQNKFVWCHADFGQGSATVAMIISRLLCIPYSFKVHAFDIYDRRCINYQGLLQQKLDTASLVFSAHQFGEQVVRKQMKDGSRRTRVNYVSVRTNDFVPLPPASRSTRFVSLGRLVEKKGFHILIESAAILKKFNVRFSIDIFGDGPEHSSLESQIARLDVGDRVFLRGKYDNGSLPQILEDAVSTIAPSVVDRNGDMDGIPTVLLESMALGRPVIATRLSGIPELVIDGQYGFLVDAEDPRQLAARMRRMLRQPKLVEEMGTRSAVFIRSTREHLACARQLVDEIDRVLSETSATSTSCLATRDPQSPRLES